VAFCFLYLGLGWSKQFLDKTGTDEEIEKEAVIKGKDYGPDFKKIFEKIWHDEDHGGCENLGSGRKTTVEACKEDCRNKDGCNAINYCHEDGCVLRGCRLPRPVPNWDGPDGWICVGHHVNKEENGIMIKCECPENYEPVCGTNGKEYGNICLALCENVKAKCKGKCPCTKKCDMIPNRNTRCRGFCNRVRVGKTNNVMQCIQKCLERDKCRHYIWYRPGTFWGKTCFVVEGEGSVYRDSSKLTITGSCRKGCNCPSVYTPVCDEDGITRHNDCEAKCAKAKIKCHNKCPCKKEEGCFAPLSTVETRDGVKTIPELRIGDEIRTSTDNLDTTGFTEFLGWLDRQKSSPVRMLQLFTADNTPAVTLSASHVVFTTNSTMYAGDLVPGDTLLHWDGVQMEEVEITEIKTSQEQGFWAPLTRSGTLLVDGFLMSCYASYPHKLADVAMVPIKAMPLTLLDDHESQHMDGVRKSISFMKSIGQSFGARKEEDVFEEVPTMNLASFINSLKFEL